jgi:hypothetical protein
VACRGQVWKHPSLAPVPIGAALRRTACCAERRTGISGTAGALAGRLLLQKSAEQRVGTRCTYANACVCRPRNGNVLRYPCAVRRVGPRGEQYPTQAVPWLSCWRKTPRNRESFVGFTVRQGRTDLAHSRTRPSERRAAEWMSRYGRQRLGPCYLADAKQASERDDGSAEADAARVNVVAPLVRKNE